MADYKPFFDLLNVRAQLWTEPELTTWTCRLAANEIRCHTISNLNLHSLYLAQGNSEFRDFLRSADAVHIDGMPVIALSRLLGVPARRKHRVTYVDWLDRLMATASERQLNVYFLGSRPGVGERAGTILRRRHPGLRIDSHHGYFDVAPGGHENQEVLDRIHRFQTDLLLVGMGMPRQECWILANSDQLRAGVCLPCGAAMDYVAGEIPTPPRWAGRFGLEWLFRLLAEPGRLAHRYLVEPWGLFIPVTTALYRRWKGPR